MPAPVAWEYDYTTEPWLRWLARAGAAAVGGAYVGALVALLTGVATALVYGSTAVRLLVVVLALVGGPVSLLYLYPVLTDPDQRPAPFSGRERRLPRREWVVSALVGAAVLGGAVLVDPLLAGALFAGGFLAGVVAVGCSTHGEIDPETGVMNGTYGEWHLRRMTGYRTRTVGPLTVVSLAASGPGRFGSVPSRVLVPTADLGDVTDALDAVVRAETHRDRRASNTAVRAVATLFALSCFGGGAAAVAAMGAPLGLYLGAIGFVFGVVFVLVAREG